MERNTTTKESNMKATEILEVTKTRKLNGITWYADADNEAWWNLEMTFAITKHHSSKWSIANGNMQRIAWAGSFKEAASYAE